MISENPCPFCGFKLWNAYALVNGEFVLVDKEFIALIDCDTNFASSLFVGGVTVDECANCSALVGF